MSQKLQTIDIRTFVFAGNATFTLVSKRTGVRFTFKVQTPDDAEQGSGPWFVRVLQGPDNESDFGFLGTVFSGSSAGNGRDGSPVYRHGKKSRIGRDAPSAKAADWFFNTVLPRGDFSQVEVWHEGSCGRCGRKLTVPESIENGLGPVCAGLV